VNDAAITGAVLVLEFTLQDVRYDLHVAVAVHAEALPGFDHIVVEDAECAPVEIGGS
jgi:hypothetical protein